jgi:hypothetical protein
MNWPVKYVWNMMERESGRQFTRPCGGTGYEYLLPSITLIIAVVWNGGFEVCLLLQRNSDSILHVPSTGGSQKKELLSHRLKTCARRGQKSVTVMQYVRTQLPSVFLTTWGISMGCVLIISIFIIFLILLRILSM